MIKIAVQLVVKEIFAISYLAELWGQDMYDMYIVRNLAYACYLVTKRNMPTSY